MLLGIIATVLAIMATFFKPHTDTFQNLLFNRIIGIMGIWIAVFMVIRIFNMQEKQKMQTEQFQALFQFASIGILIVNAEGRIVKINAAAEKLFGYTFDEIEGQTIEIFLPSRVKYVHISHRQHYNTNPNPRTMGSGRNLFAQRKDGSEFPVEVSLSPFQTKQGNFVVAFVVDNTQRAENEQHNLRQNQRLEQLASALQNLNETLELRITERTKALEKARNELSVALSKERDLGELKSRFVSMASHEFRTPLSTVQSSAALINSYADRDDIPNIKKHVQRIKNSVGNLSTILTEFLSLGKIEEGQTQINLQEMDLPECIEEAILELKPMLKAGQTMEYHHTGNKNTKLDPALLKHTLLNLMTNAMKYSPENTVITVTTTVTPGNAEIRVIDQGMGIPEADQKHLFSRFFRATNASNIQGTGLGLYIVKRYVEMMNGTIDFKSEEGVGTTIWANFVTEA
ncbi:MAG: PAS domain S-box protein [Lewinellaceae bacterium]|nr:PAS domain S-box protein [Lewinellaceae bacterium]